MVTWVQALLVARVALGMAAWEPGWSALTWDDFTRVLLGMRWAEAPFLAVDDLVWLPLQTWVLGLLYLLTGDLLADNPMLGAALLNTAAVMGAAGLVGRAAWHLFRSPSGALLAFGAVLFSPWGFYTSLSGHNEPFAYLGVGAAVWGLAAWGGTGKTTALWVGSAGVLAVTLLRYEGWWLAGAWALTVPVVALMLRRSPLRPAPPALLPLAGPAWWMGLNLLRTGDPLSFAGRTARYMAEGGFGAALFADPVARVAYHPFALLNSAPLLLPVLGVVLVPALRRSLGARALALLVGTWFGLFYLSGLVVPSFGGLAERYLFAFVVGLAPLLGVLPGLVRRLPRARAVGAAALAVAVLVTGYRLADPPREWAHGPDLLTLAVALGEGAERAGRPLEVVLEPGLTVEPVPVTALNGRRVLAWYAGDDGAPARPDLEVWEAGPDRPADLGLGRYRLAGQGTTLLGLPVPDCHRGWTGEPVGGAVPEGPMLAVVPDRDLAPGEIVRLARSLPAADRAREAALELLWLHDLGGSAVRVSVDGETLWQRDLGRRLRWHRVELTVPPGPEPVEVRVEVLGRRPEPRSFADKILTAFDRGSSPRVPVLVRGVEVEGGCGP